MMGFERWINGLSVHSDATSHSMRISFSIPAGAATNEPRSAMNTKRPLVSGEAHAVTMGTGKTILVYKINMEKMAMEAAVICRMPAGKPSPAWY